MNPQDPREFPTARKKSWPPPSSDVSGVRAGHDPLQDSLATLLKTQRSAGVQAPLPIVSRVVVGMLRRIRAGHIADDTPSDVYGAAVILWESLAARPFHPRTAEDHEPASRYRVGLDSAVDAIVARGLSSGPAAHFDGAVEMAAAVEAALPPATPAEIGAWVELLARQSLEGVTPETTVGEPPARPEVPPPPSVPAIPAPVAAVDTAPAPPPPEPLPSIGLQAAPRIASERVSTPTIIRAEPSIEIRLEPGQLGGARVEVVTRRLRTSAPPGASAPKFGRAAPLVLGSVIAGTALLAAVSLRFFGDRPDPHPVPAAVAVAATIAARAPAPNVALATATPASQAANDEGPIAAPPDIPTLPPAAAASSPAPAPRSAPHPSRPRPPSRRSRDDVL
jgi:hypothetical protein